MKFPFRSGALAWMVGLAASGLSHASSFTPYDAMPSLFGLSPIDRHAEIIVSYWMTVYFVLSLCGVPILIALDYLRAERTRREFGPEHHAEPAVETKEEEQKRPKAA